MNTRRTIGKIALEIFMVLLSFVFLYPLFVAINNSFKTFGEVMRDVIALPQQMTFENYVYVWEFIDYPRLFLNNFIVTALGLIGIIFVASTASYKLSRTKTRMSIVIYMMCIIPMLIPFQSIMLPVLQLAKTLNLSESTVGLGLLYWGFCAPMAVFIYHGFVKGIPREIDESATIDGASGYRLFFQIILPLLKPVTTTIVIIDVMWIWNDFLLPLLVLHSADIRTIPLQTYSFFGQYTKQWDLALAGLVLGVAPMVAFFLLMQKHIIAGISAGAVKG